MKKICNTLFCLVMSAIVPGIAGAAGTYYNTGNVGKVYQERYGNPGLGYSKVTTGRSYTSRYGQSATSGNPMLSRTTTTTTTTTRKAMSTQKNAKKQGFVVGGGLTHEFANWGFDMDSAGSELHYDNIRWNVLDVNGTYYFGDTTPMQVKLGARYGVQFGDSPMIDDDISNGGYLVTTWTDGNNTIGYQTGHAISVGTSNGGSQHGFNLAFGLTDFFKYKNIKMTPSIGYRYFKYKLSTEKNYGLTLDIFEATNAHDSVTCISGYLGEIQCDPFLLFYDASGNPSITGRIIDDEGNVSLVQIPAGSVQLDVGGTYYYEQMGTSHEYETTWAGPYVALDAEYTIDSKNAIVGGIELGLPVYSSEGNQPYRYDWAHPKSVEDKGSFGDAFHFGMNAMWKTAVTDATMLTLGFTYDYYSVSKASAKTFLNSAYYTELYNAYEDAYDAAISDAERNYYANELDTIDEYRAAGWVLQSSKEVNSVYKSMGIRLGVEVKF